MNERRSPGGAWIWWLLLVAAGGAGLFAGGAWKQLRRPAAEVVPPRMPLQPGDPFPNVSVVGPAGEAATSAQVARAGAGLVLLLDPECPPCERMAEAWEGRRRASAPDARGIVAIAEGPASAAKAFAERLNLGYPVWADTARALRARAGIDDFPIAVWVDSLATVRAATFDPRIAERSAAK